VQIEQGNLIWGRANSAYLNLNLAQFSCKLTKPIRYYSIHYFFQNFHFHFTSSKNIKSKTFLLFYTFYITSIIFYYYSTKKINYKTNYKTFSNFLSHQSFLTTIQINIPILNHLPNKPTIFQDIQAGMLFLGHS
jgi:hypothetical protein